MLKKVETIDLNTNVKRSASVVAKKRIGSLVVNQGGMAVRIVTERDLVSKGMADGLDPGKVPVRDIILTPDHDSAGREDGWRGQS